MSTTQLTYNFVNDENTIATITLNENVLGGNEALEFTSLLNQLSEKNVRFVIIDLSKVTVMNSSGLGMLVSGLSTLRKHSINMFLSSVPEKVNHLLTITHLDRVFKSYADNSQAIANCK